MLFVMVLVDVGLLLPMAIYGEGAALEQILFEQGPLSSSLRHCTCLLYVDALAGA